MERQKELEAMESEKLVVLVLAAETANAELVKVAQEAAVAHDAAIATKNEELATAISEFESAKAELRAQLAAAEEKAAKGEEALANVERVEKFKDEVKRVHGLFRAATEASDAADAAHKAAKGALHDLIGA